MGICGVKRCRRVARQAFDVFDPWRANYHGVGNPAPGTPMEHYEVCDEHAAEFWPHVPGYVEKENAARIRERVVPC